MNSSENAGVREFEEYFIAITLKGRVGKLDVEKIDIKLGVELDIYHMLNLYIDYDAT